MGSPIQVVAGGDVFRGMSVAHFASPTSPRGSLLVTHEQILKDIAGVPAPSPNLIRRARDVGGNVDIRVFGIEGFQASRGMLDKTDPFVRVTYEGKTMKTAVKANAGGTVAFDETLSFTKQKDRHIIKVAVMDSETFQSNEVLAEREIDLSKLPLEDWNEFIENAKPVAFELKDRSGKAAGRVLLGFAACTIQIKIFHIENFMDNETGLMGTDKIDPFVRLTYGGKVFKTKTASNAGGNAVFDEIAEFQRDPKVNKLQVDVLESDAGGLHEDLLGTKEIDLTTQFYCETFTGSTWIQAIMVDLTKDGKVQGAVKLAFCKIPHVHAGKDGTLFEKARLGQKPEPKKSFTGAVHIKVFKIEGFADSSGMMDKTDPYVSITMGKATQKTKVKNNAGGSAKVDEVLSFQKDQDTVSMKVKVFDSDTLSNDLLGEKEVDLTRQVYIEDLEDATRGVPIELLNKQGQFAGKVYLAFSACVIHCHVQDIHGFSNTAGFMDKTDPYVKLSIGKKEVATQVKNNAGGSAVFDQTLSLDKLPGQHFLKIQVMDRDTASDDVLGERDIDLRKQYYWPSANSGQLTAVDMYKNGKIAGTVNLSFAKSPKKPNQAKSMPKEQQATSKWVPSREEPAKMVMKKVTPCEEVCGFCCFCCWFAEKEVTRAAVAVVGEDRLPDGFRAVGYRVDLQGKWDKRTLAGEEIHRLDIKPGDNSLVIGGSVEVPPQYNLRTSPLPFVAPLPFATAPMALPVSSPLPVALPHNAFLASPLQQNSMMMATPGHFSPQLRYGV